eukprot:scaffold46475_cov48-Phaeocystis_antarctica.AAC.1
MDQHGSPLCIRRYHIICLGLIFGGYAPESLPRHPPGPSTSQLLQISPQLTSRRPSGSRGAPAEARQSPPPSCPKLSPRRAS